MKDSDNYPAGTSANDPHAPWNEKSKECECDNEKDEFCDECESAEDKASRKADHDRDVEKDSGWDE